MDSSQHPGLEGETEAEWGLQAGFRPVGARTSRPGSVPGGSLHPSACRRLSHGLTHRRPPPEVPTETLSTVRKLPPLQAACAGAAPPPTRVSLLVARDHAYLPNRACVPASLADWCSPEEVSFAPAQVCSHLPWFNGVAGLGGTGLREGGR